MTWKEFKERVEAQGVRDDDRIDYIDVAADVSDYVDVVRDDQTGCAICG